VCVVFSRPAPALLTHGKVAERTRLIHNRDVNARFRYGVQ
jgi:hypothetical protein